MAKLDERVELIGSAIRDKAASESKIIIQKANDIREQAIQEYEEKVIQQMFTQMQRDANALRNNAIKSIAQLEVDAHRTLLRRRTELTSSVFSTVRARLREFTNLEQYLPWLIKHLELYANQYEHSQSTLLLRPDDLALQDKLTPFLPGCTVEADPTIKIGGFRIQNTKARILINETLDAKLEENRPWFLQACGLSIL